MVLTIRAATAVAAVAAANMRRSSISTLREEQSLIKWELAAGQWGRRHLRERRIVGSIRPRPRSTRRVERPALPLAPALLAALLPPWEVQLSPMEETAETAGDLSAKAAVAVVALEVRTALGPTAAIITFLRHRAALVTTETPQAARQGLVRAAMAAPKICGEQESAPEAGAGQEITLALSTAGPGRIMAAVAAALETAVQEALAVKASS